MANYTTVDDLKRDALWRAGESTDGTSDYDDKVLDYLNAAQLGLLVGGPFGTSDDKGINLPVVDWWWALKYPRGVFNTEAALTVGTVSVTQGGTTVTFSSAPVASIAGWRIRINGLTVVPYITAHTAGAAQATLDAAWTEATQTDVSYVAFNLDYAMASDFLRLAGEPVLPVDPYHITVVDRTLMEATWPTATVSAFVQNTPLQAAFIDPQRLQLSHYTMSPVRIEYGYVRMPDDLVAGAGEPLLPRPFRRFLAVVAAGLICLDKSDNKADALFVESKVLLQAMFQEHRHHLRRMSAFFGQIKSRVDYQTVWGPYAVYWS